MKIKGERGQKTFKIKVNTTCKRQDLEYTLSWIAELGVFYKLGLQPMVLSGPNSASK